MDIDGQTDGDVEYVSEAIDVKAPGLEAFSNVFARFQASEASAAVCHLCMYLVSRLANGHF
jgi:hypothetical protein